MLESVYCQMKVVSKVCGTTSLWATLSEILGFYSDFAN